MTSKSETVKKVPAKQVGAYALFSLKFLAGMQVQISVAEEKIIGRWDEIVWAPMIDVGSALCNLTHDLLKALGFHGTVQRKPPFARPDKEVVELGDDITLAADAELPEEILLKISAAALMFSLQIREKADVNSEALDFIGSLSASDRSLVSRNINIFLSKNSGKIIPESFVCIVGKHEIMFAGRFARAPIEPISPGPVVEIRAKVEGAERNGKRAKCTLLLDNDQRRKANFPAEVDLLVKVRDALWSNAEYSIRIAANGTAQGNESWDLVDLMECAQPVAQLFD
ncbi:MAG: hypothetical protein M0Z99_24720 [Betaproteobacteria bacterium]|nr:hypothetical protein [Betaproteobacteria bacterium]